MTRYKLPDELGGAIVRDAQTTPAAGGWMEQYGYRAMATDDATGWIVVVHASALTELPPPHPPEPEPGPYLIGTQYVLLTAAGDGRTYVHQPGERGATEWSYWWSKFGDGLTAEDIHRLVAESSDRAHREVRGWTGPSGVGVECSCGIVVDHCATLAEARAGHIDAPESSDRAQPSTVVLPWKYTDPDGDELVVEANAGSGRRNALVELTDHDGNSLGVHLDTHEARMGAVAAIVAADREIGGAE